MRTFYDPGGVAKGLLGSLTGGVIGTSPVGDDDGSDEAAAQRRAREEERMAQRRRRGRSSTLFAGRGGGLASAQIGVRRSTLGGG